MHLSRRPSALVPVLLLGLVLTPTLAFAGPTAGPLMGTLQGILDWLTTITKFFIVPIGLTVALIGGILGRQGAIEKGVAAFLCGAAVFGLSSLMSWLASISQ